jgi:hypothetical protein
VEDIKRVLGQSVFLRDVRTVEPGKTGVIVGDALRVYKEDSGYTLRFLSGTEEKTRRQFRDRLEQNGISYKEGDDFEL